MIWIKYLLEANLYMVLFYAVYYLLLRRETYYQLNRFYLLGCIVLSFGIPLLQLGFLRPAPAMIEQMTAPIIITHQTAADLPLLLPTELPAVQAEPINYYLWAYIVVAVIMAVALLAKIYQLTKLARKGKHTIANHFNMVELDEDEHAFSFFSYLFISKKLVTSNTIIQHEMVHIQQKHSLDIMFMELVKIICWFNPVIYLAQLSLKELHEFIADDKIATVNNDVNNYTDFLISNAYGLQPIAITNNFFTKNLLKKRIMMLHQKRSGGLARLKYLVALPLLIGMLCVSTLGFTKDYPVYDLLPKLPLIKKPITAKASKPAKTLQAMVNEALTVPNPELKDSSFITIRGLGKIDSLFGATSPLYVIDGVVITKENAAKFNIKNFGNGKSPLESIQQEDILSMEILKDASAVSIYGAKGKNGVILINTKKGQTTKLFNPGNHPLVFVDGAPFEWKDSDLGFDDNGMAKSWLSLIPQETIASMEVFKPEEATKIYGDKGANGAILIITIQGQAKKAAEAKAPELKTFYIIDPKKYTYQSLAEIAEAFSKQGYRFNYRELDMNTAMPLLEVALKRETGSSKSNGGSATFRLKELKEINYVIAVGFNDESVFVRSVAQGQVPNQVGSNIEPAKADTVDKETLESFYKHIRNSALYPNAAREKGIQGKVFVIFNVNQDNTVTNTKILRGLSEETNKEVIRVIKSWKAPKGAPKDRNFTVPISFDLQYQEGTGEVKAAVITTTDNGSGEYTRNDFKTYQLRETVIHGYVRKNREVTPAKPDSTTVKGYIRRTKN